jgi:hypothetical protein
MLFFFTSSLVNGAFISEGFDGNKIIKTRIVAIGGEGLSSVEMYESRTGAWASLPDMTTQRAGAASCIVGSKVIVAGGFDGRTSLKSSEYLDLEPKGGKMKWTVMPSIKMKKSRSALGGVLLDDGVTFFVTGGYNGKTTINSCAQLDTLTMTWSDAPSMASARSAHCTVLYKKKAAVIGGLIIEKQCLLALCEEYDRTRKTWSVFPPLIQARSRHGACVLNDGIFVCGGVGDGSVSSVEVFDGVKWSLLESSLSMTRYTHACVVLKGKVVVLGGNQEEVEVYDEAQRKWRRDVIPSMLAPSRFYLTAVSF